MVTLWFGALTAVIVPDSEVGVVVLAVPTPEQATKSSMTTRPTILKAIFLSMYVFIFVTLSYYISFWLTEKVGQALFRTPGGNTRHPVLLQDFTLFWWEKICFVSLKECEMHHHAYGILFQKASHCVHEEGTRNNVGTGFIAQRRLSAATHVF